MEIRPNSIIASLIETHQEDERRVAERDHATAAQFPESIDDYLNLPSDERMRIAVNILSTYYPFFSFDKFDSYSDIPPKGENGNEKSAESRVATDKPGFVVNGRIAYDRGAITPYSKGWSRRPSAIYVWAQAENTVDGTQTSFQRLGRIEVGLTNDIFAREPFNERAFDLDDQRAKDMIELIDDGVCRLIEGKIASDRNASLGRRALQASNTQITDL